MNSTSLILDLCQNINYEQNVSEYTSGRYLQLQGKLGIPSMVLKTKHTNNQIPQHIHNLQQLLCFSSLD